MERKETLPPRTPITDFPLPQNNNVANDIEQSKSNIFNLMMEIKQRHEDGEFLRNLEKKVK